VLNTVLNTGSCRPRRDLGGEIRMLHPMKTLCTAVAVLGLAASALAGEAKWYADYDEAAKVASESGKDLLVDFTGSDWCGWCKRLHKEVFALPEFEQGVEQDFVLVALDFPRSEEVIALVPNPARNAELRDQHGIQGYPTILLMTPAGEVYGRTGYRPGGPQAYVDHLGVLRTGGKRALKELPPLLSEFESAEGEARLQSWDKLADMAELLGGESPFSASLAEPLRFAFTADPANEQGRKLRAVKALFSMGLAEESDYALATELDPANANGLRESALGMRFGSVRSDEMARAAIEELTAFEAAAKFKDQELAQGLYINSALWLSEKLGDPEAAKAFAQKALDTRPEDPELVTKLESIVAGT
jgi:thioredoxin-related protein